MSKRGQLAEAVYCGAKLLDQREPDWWNKIDLDTFSIWHADLCMVGQLRPGYWYTDAVKDLLGIDGSTHGANSQALDDARELGFDVPNDYTGLYYTRACECLTRMWTRAIMARRNPVTLYITTI